MIVSHPNEISYHASSELEEIVMGLGNDEPDDPFEILAALEEEAGIPLVYLTLRLED